MSNAALSLVVMTSLFCPALAIVRAPAPGLSGRVGKKFLDDIGQHLVVEGWFGVPVRQHIKVTAGQLIGPLLGDVQRMQRIVGGADHSCLASQRGEGVRAGVGGVGRQLDEAPGTRHGTVQRLRGEGPPRTSGKGNTDIHYRFVIELPDKLTDAQAKAVDALAKTINGDPRSKLFEAVT